MELQSVLKLVIPIVAALAGAAGGGTLGYQDRDEDFQRVVTKYRAVKHELAVCLTEQGHRQ